MIETIFIFNCIFQFVLYIAMAFSLYKIAVNNNVKNPWLAFVPIVQYYVIGAICEEYVLLGYRIKHLQLTIILLALLQTILNFTGGFTYLILKFLVNIIMVLILHKFFYLFSPQRAVLYAIFSFLGTLPLVLILFYLKDSPMCMSAGAFPYPFDKRI